MWLTMWLSVCRLMLFFSRIKSQSIYGEVEETLLSLVGKKNKQVSYQDDFEGCGGGIRQDKTYYKIYFILLYH